MRIVLTGGGTGGASTPLLAMTGEIKRRIPNVEFLFIGTARGPERDLARAAGIPFVVIPSGKLRRYPSFQNFLDPIRVLVGFVRALGILRAFRPTAVVGVGSYVSVPVVWTARAMAIPSLIHQQDIAPGLANRLCAPAASAITVTFEQSLRHFPRSKTFWTGNPIRPELVTGNPESARERFGLQHELPVVLAFGGGTGALRINQLIAEAGLNLVKYAQILEITGRRQESFRVQHPNFHTVEFLATGMSDAYAVADVVVCRAGLSTLTELSALAKPAIVIPIPDSHQERNAAYFEHNHAAIVLDERTLTHQVLEETILGLLDHPEQRTSLSENVKKLSQPGANEKIVDIVMAISISSAERELVRALRQKNVSVRPNEPLRKHTHFRIGGPADVFVVGNSRDSIVRTVALIRPYGVPWFVLGGGANVVLPDRGYRGVVIQMKNADCSVQGTAVTVGAGMNTGQCASRCLDAGLVGMEFVVGIYGTIGGAVRGNAGSFGKEMKDVVESCEVITADGAVEHWSNARFNFAYRDSAAKREPVIILTVTLRLQKGDAAAAREKILTYASYKRSHQPVHLPSAGCMFKNYELKPDDDALRQQFANNLKGDTVPAWALIAEAGLAGKRIGNIQVSEQHANFFVNLGNGTAEQVVMLSSLVKQAVRDRFGAQLQEEVQFIGF